MTPPHTARRRSPAAFLLLGAVFACLVAAGVGAAEGPDDEAGEGIVFPRQEPLFAPPDDRPLTAGFLIVDGVYNTELTAPFDILQHTIFHTEPGIEVFTVSPDGEPVTSFEGLRIAADHSFEDAPEIDLLVVPSAEHNMDSDLEDEELIGWVRETGRRAKYVMSLCDGAFVLAEAGLLERRHVTTFPADQDRFAELFPKLDLEREVSFVHDGRAFTSVGGAKSFDVALYFVDHLYGEEVAQRVARGLVLPWPPGPEPFRALVVDYSRAR